MARKRTTSAQFDPEDEKWIRHVAATNERSFAYVVRVAIRLLKKAMGGGDRLPDVPPDNGTETRE